MDSAANATKPGRFWKRLKPLLPSSGPDNSDETCIIDDGVVVNEPSNLFNEYFSTPALSQDWIYHLKNSATIQVLHQFLHKTLIWPFLFSPLVLNT